MSKNAPGGSINRAIGFSPRTGRVNRCKSKYGATLRVSWPVPSNSLRKEMIIIAMAKPADAPRASAIARCTGCLELKASARPIMMQLTTMRGRNIPSESAKVGINALSVRSAIVTKLAMTTMNIGILTMFGTRFLILDTTMAEPAERTQWQGSFQCR